MRDLIDRVRPQIETALAGIGDAHDLMSNVGRIGYNAERFSFTVTFSRKVETTTGKVFPAQFVNDWDRTRTRMPGAEAIALGDTFSHNGGTYEFTEYRPNAPKYAVIGRNCSTSKDYKFTVRSLIDGFRRLHPARV